MATLLATAWREPLERWLRTLAPRERRAVQLAAVVVVLALLWLLLLRPPLRVLREAPARIATATQQLQELRALAEDLARLSPQKLAVPTLAQARERLQTQLASTPATTGVLVQDEGTGLHISAHQLRTEAVLTLLQTVRQEWRYQVQSLELRQASPAHTVAATASQTGINVPGPAVATARPGVKPNNTNNTNTATKPSPALVETAADLAADNLSGRWDVELRVTPPAPSGAVASSR